jgi:hypothetical protein
MVHRQELGQDFVLALRGFRLKILPREEIRWSRVA